MNLVAIALFIIMAVILIKFKLVCEVTANGEKLGYIADKEKFEQSVNDIINKEEDNKLYTTIANIPEYHLTFVDKTEETNDEEVLAKIEESSETTYKLYAVTVEGKEKVKLSNLEEAENLVKELNKTYKKQLEKQIGIVEVITTDNQKDVTTIKTAKANITKELDKTITKTSTTSSKSVTSVNTSIKNTTSSKSSTVSKTKSTTTKSTTATTSKKSNTTSSSSTKTTSVKVASLNGVQLTVKPLSGKITSRFGGRESIRSSGHTGLDIAAPKGTKIKAAASGTVIFAGYSGAYGNVVKISHGSGIKTYYAHCSKLYVKKGQKVSAGDIIAAVGSTGRSTGNHLHFEVVKNGTSLNPQNYLYK